MSLVRRLGITFGIVALLLSVGGLKFVRDAYPGDPFKSEALRNCLAHDPAFIRFSPEQRAGCYARQPQMPGYTHAENSN
ncbi:MAG TPA: hypothetical protein VHW66_07960 [Stellaceae bacterium]|jgi:hypothetical protein|nr:hypothetical protein [Stellaceae bacterium]